MMKHQNLLALLLTMFSVITVSCSNDDEDEDLMGKWYRVSDFDGLARGEATSFTIGNKGYLTGGYDARKHLNDLWEYDMELDFWTQKLLSRELPVVHPQHFPLAAKDTSEQVMTEKLLQ